MGNKISDIRNNLSSFGLFSIIASFIMLFVYLFLIFLGIKFAGNLILGTKTTISPTPTPTLLPIQTPTPSPTPPVTLGDSATKEV